MNEFKIGDIRYKEIGSYEEVYAVTGFSSDGSPIWTLLFDQPERSKREDVIKKYACGNCTACRWYPCIGNSDAVL